jgi:hypothetical protein
MTEHTNKHTNMTGTELEDWLEAIAPFDLDEAIDQPFTSKEEQEVVDALQAVLGFDEFTPRP